MKRCIYGVDLNPMAVELAKVSLWLHSFTVGAPLSFLDHHLKAGNSLIGTSVDTVIEAADLFGNIQQEILGGTKFLQDAAFNTDATISDVEESAADFHDYQNKMEPYKRLLDLWTSQHFDNPKGPTLVRDYTDYTLEVINKNGGGAVLKDFADTIATAEQLQAEKRIFHWELEFPEVFYNLDPPGEKQNPGFDAVVGNPPYSFGRDWGELPQKDYFSSQYRCAQYQIDLYHLFMESGLQLVGEGGLVSFIVPDVWTHAVYSNQLRELYLNSTHLEKILGLPTDVFEDATVDTVVFSSKRVQPVDDALTQVYELSSAGDSAEYCYSIEQKSFTRNEDRKIDFWTSPTIRSLLQRSRDKSVRLEDICETTRGINAYDHHQGQSKETIESRAYHADHQVDESFSPLMMGKNTSRYLNQWDGEHWIQYGEWLAAPREERIFNQRKLLTRKLLSNGRIVCLVDDDEFYVDQQLYVGINPEAGCDLYYICAVVNSTYMSFHYRQSNREEGVEFPQMTVAAHDSLPIRDIAFTTPEDERAAHVQALTDAYATTREVDADPTANDVLHKVEAHLAGDPGSPDRSPGQAASGTRPERADVVHDLLAHLAREMTRLKRERASYHLNLTDYLAEPEGPASIGLTELGTRYQPAPGVQQSLLADTTSERDGLRIGTLSAERPSDTVIVRATVRYKPKDDENIPDDALDRWGYHETDPVAVCTLHGCTDLESGLLTHWLDVLNAHGSGYSGYRDQATKTNSLLDRLHAARFPDPRDESVLRGLRPFLKNATAAARLDAHLTFTDALIDQIVYRLYGLSDEEVRVVEGTE